jgi:hypothetical protein
MRLLEKCSPHWPIEAIRGQIENLRTAFSADVTKPFELKPGFPFVGSPPPPMNIVPAMMQNQKYQPDVHFNPQPNHAHLVNQVNHQHPLTPPISIIGEDYKDPHIPHSIPLLPQQLQPTSSPVIQHIPQEQWNPTQILE